MKYACEVEAMQWNGKNTKDIVKFCMEDLTLCCEYLEQQYSLTIYPTDTMRYSSIDIPLNGYVVKMKSSGGVFIKPYNVEIFHTNFYHKGDYLKSNNERC